MLRLLLPEAMSDLRTSVRVRVAGQAAVVVALMYAGGQYLESFAGGRARREMTKLLSRVPRTALRHRAGLLEEVGLDVLEPGDRIMVRRGEVVAVDGAVAEGVAVLDQSALTGETLPVQQHAGEAVLSGSTNAGDTFDLIVSARAEASTYAGIVRLVEAAQQSKAPMARLADRFAMAFLGVTVAMADGAWIWTGDPIRALAVLIVALPCPLILAVLVAIISGVSRAAKLGILIKGGRALENLARVRTLVIDKTGPLTDGAARLVSTQAAPGFEPADVLGLAASLDQASSHVIAQVLVPAAREKGCTLTTPETVFETPGEGVEGLVGGRKVSVGGPSFVGKRASAAAASVSRRARYWSRSMAESPVVLCFLTNYGLERRSCSTVYARQGSGGLCWRRVIGRLSPTPSPPDCRSTQCVPT